MNKLTQYEVDRIPIDVLTKMLNAESISRRDELAKAAMQSLIGTKIHGITKYPSTVAKQAYEMADAMIEESK